MFERSGRKEVTFEASREIAKPKTMLKPRKVSDFVRINIKYILLLLAGTKLCTISEIYRAFFFSQVSTGGKRKKDEIYVDSLDFNKKILHTAWHPSENVIAVAATNNLFLLQVINWKTLLPPRIYIFVGKGGGPENRFGDFICFRDKR